jgi:hypothetical protein
MEFLNSGSTRSVEALPLPAAAAAVTMPRCYGDACAYASARITGSHLRGCGFSLSHIVALHQSSKGMLPVRIFVASSARYCRRRGCSEHRLSSGSRRLPHCHGGLGACRPCTQGQILQKITNTNSHCHNHCPTSSVKGLKACRPLLPRRRHVLIFGLMLMYIWGEEGSNRLGPVLLKDQNEIRSCALRCCAVPIHSPLPKLKPATVADVHPNDGPLVKPPTELTTAAP